MSATLKYGTGAADDAAILHQEETEQRYIINLSTETQQERFNQSDPQMGFFSV